jgi:hypothetical protein
MPKVIGAMRQRCQEWISRPSPCVSPHASDDEEQMDNDQPMKQAWGEAGLEEGDGVRVIEDGVEMTLV